MYLDTADVVQVKKGLETGAFEGVTTNPSILAKGRDSRFSQLHRLQGAHPGRLFVQVIGDTADERLADARRVIGEFGAAGLGLKVPVDMVGLKTISALKGEFPSVSLLGTAIYSSDQALFAALSGADVVAPYVNRMLINNIDPFEQISQMRTLFARSAVTTKIMGASFKNCQQVVDALLAGADLATLPWSVFEQMMTKELATSAITVFNKQGAELDARTARTAALV